MIAKRPLVIAEAGVNHNGSIDMALEMISVAAKSGADYIKFQTFQPERLVSRHAEKAEYQKHTTDACESQFDMLRKYVLSKKDHEILMQECMNQKIAFLSTAFDEESLYLLCSLGLSLIKIPSGEITNWPLLYEVGKAGVKVIISTGMSSIEEIREALSVFLVGALCKTLTPDKLVMQRCFYSEAGQAYLKKNVILLHCTTQYPTPYSDVNLLAMDLLNEEFGVPVGYSDHTKGVIASLTAVARGAVIIEKHFTLDKNLPGPDHQASLEPPEFVNLVVGIGEICDLLGERKKEMLPSEEKNLRIVRKSIVAKTSIYKGDIFSTENIGVKRPGTGLSPSVIYKIIGNEAKKNYAEDELILPIECL